MVMEEIGIVKDEDISVKTIIEKINTIKKYLLSKWHVFLIAGLFGALLGLAYSVIKKPVYTASVSFALADSKSAGGLGAYSGLASQFGFDLGGGGSTGAFSGDNLLLLIKSRSIIEKTLLSVIDINGKRQTLADIYIDFNHYRDGWQNNSRLNNISFGVNADRSKFTLQQDSLLGLFYKNLLANNLTVDKIDKKLSIILVNVVSKNEIFSKYFAEKLVNNVSAFYVETKTKKTAYNIYILQHQTDSVKAELRNDIYGVASSVDVNPSANPTRAVLRAPTQRKQVDVQVNTAMLVELIKNLEAAKISLRNETPLVQIIDTPILPLDIEKVSKLKGLVIGFMIGLILSVFAITIRKIVQSFTV
jgi:uncharacterized protein YbcV (DUF1398 family)